ncbi:hypothetical protein A2U01_0107867, partial [Trifolium medium]|nr:hypothetical protein [Trifolium medium]
VPPESSKKKKKRSSSKKEKSQFVDETVKDSETLGSEEPKSVEDLVKDDVGYSHDANVVDDGSEKANVESVT